MHVIDGYYDPLLVIISIIVALVSSYTAIYLFLKTARYPQYRQRSLLIGAFAMGTGGWAMYYIGMLAYQLPFPVAYRIDLVFLSEVAMVLASYGALYIAAHGRRAGARWRALSSGVVLTSGIAIMNHFGMRSIITPYPMMMSDLSRVMAGVIGVLLTAVTFLLLTEKSSWESMRVPVVGTFTLAIGLAGFRYTIMLGMHFAVPLSIRSMVIQHRFLAFALGLGTMSLTGLALYALRLEQYQLRQTHHDERRLALLIGNAADMVVIIDSQGDVLYVNPAAAEIMGRSVDNLIGMNVYTQIDDIDGLREAVKGIAAGEHDEIAFRLRTYQGQWIEAESTIINLLEDRDIQGYVAYVRDITQKRLYEQEMVRAQKLESLGHLAGGIAHDFNNILTVILTHVSLMRMDSEMAEVALDAIETAAERAVDLTTRMLTLSRGGEPITKPRSIETILTGACRLALSGSNVGYRIRLPENPLVVDVDEGQMYQVFQNLLINAQQAMPDGGRIEITVSQVTLSLDHPSGLDPGEYVSVRVCDTGRGIPESVISQIFDPYFTTKSGGNGLGLFTVYTIIQRHQGHISLVETSSQGSLFEIHLPVSPQRIDEEAEETFPALPLSQKTRILVVDDEIAIRFALGQYLENKGLSVLYASSAPEAMALMKQIGSGMGPVDLAILDLTLTESQSGMEVARYLRTHFPAVKIIVSSGYSKNAEMASAVQEGWADAVLPKPYTTELMLKTIGSVMSPSALLPQAAH